jgi:uncharacterized protein HemX
VLASVALVLALTASVYAFLQVKDWLKRKNAVDKKLQEQIDALAEMSRQLGPLVRAGEATESGSRAPRKVQTRAQKKKLEEDPDWQL